MKATPPANYGTLGQPNDSDCLRVNGTIKQLAEAELGRHKPLNW